MSKYAKILSLSYNSAVATKISALKTYYRSVRLIKDADAINPPEPSHITNILLCGNCVDPENRNLYVFYIDTYLGAAWIIEINVDSRVQTVVYYDQYNAIGFNQNNKIYNARVVYGKLIWTDNLNPIYQMDIGRAKNSFYYGIGYGNNATMTEWSKIVPYATGNIVSNGNSFYKALSYNTNEEPKLNESTIWEKLCLIEDAYYSMNVENFFFEPVPPKHPPVVTYESDDTRKINNLRQTLFQVACGYVYMDWRKSTFSPASIVSVPQAEEETATGLANEQISLNNKLRISVNLGGEEVRAVEVIGRSSVDPSKWFLIETINKFEEQERGGQISRLTKPGYCALSITVMPPTVVNFDGPNPPVALTSPNILPTSFMAVWNPNNGTSRFPDGFYLDVATDSGFTSFVSNYHNKNLGNIYSTYVTGLSSNTTYYYRIRAYYIEGTYTLISKNSNAISVVIPLLPPTALHTSSIFATGFTANWSAAEGATGYYFDVSTVDTFASFVGIYNNLDVGNVLHQDVTGLVVETAYFYRVRAYSTLGTSVNSEIKGVVTQAPPAIPVASAATEITLSSFKANWGVSLGAVGYYLDVATDNGFVNLIQGFNSRFVGDVLTYPITGLNSNTNYYYRIRAIGAYELYSASSNTISVLTKLTPPLALSPTDIFATGFTANWGAVVGATGYCLDVAGDIGFAGIIAGYNNKDVGNVLTSSVVDLYEDANYYYRVRAYTGIQTSDNSNSINARTAQPPAYPIATPATNISLEGFNATWDESLGAAGYYLYIATDIDFTSMVAGYDGHDVGKTLNYLISGLDANTTYYYRLKAYDLHLILSGYSNIVSVKTLLGAPVALSASLIYAIGFTANWNISLGALGYYLDVALNSVFTLFVEGYNNLDVGSVTMYDVEGLSVNTNYYYRIRAYNEIGTSDNSNIISLTTTAPPADVVATAATNVISNGFTANWNISALATGYFLQVATDIGFGNLVLGYLNKDIGNVLSSLVRGLNSSTQYYYRLQAYDASNSYSGYSNIIGVVTTAPLAPDPPTGLSATNVLTTSFAANWNASALATGYRLSVSVWGDFNTCIEGYDNRDVGNVLTFNITGLDSATGYYWKLRAYNNSGTSNSSGSVYTATATAPAPTISLEPATWNFGGVGIYKRIDVTLTDADTWGINFPSVNNDIQAYYWDIEEKYVVLYYTGEGPADTLQFWVTGPGGSTQVMFTGYWT